MGGSQERYDSVGVMENRRRRAREQPTPRGKEKDTADGEAGGGREETLSLLCVSSADRIVRTESSSWDRFNV